MGKVLVIGSSNTDIVMQVPHLPRPGETVIGTGMQVVQGGKGANQAVACARMGGQTVFVASIGNDDFGETAIEGYRNDHLDLTHIVRSEEPTGTALIHIEQSGENCISVNPGANAGLKAALLTHDMFDEIDLLLIQLEVPGETVMRAIEMARSLNIRVMLNPAPAVELPELDFADLFLFTPNETETEFYTGVRVTSEDSAAEAASVLRQKGCDGVIITMGAQGVYCSTSSVEGLIKGYIVNPLDTTAAGDVFNGALAAGLSAKEDIHRAINIAQAAAALSVTRLGAQPSIPRRQEVRAEFQI